MNKKNKTDRRSYRSITYKGCNVAELFNKQFVVEQMVVRCGGYFDGGGMMIGELKRDAFFWATNRQFGTIKAQLTRKGIEMVD